MERASAGPKSLRGGGGGGEDSTVTVSVERWNSVKVTSKQRSQGELTNKGRPLLDAAPSSDTKHVLHVLHCTYMSTDPLATQVSILVMSVRPHLNAAPSSAMNRALKSRTKGDSQPVPSTSGCSRGRTMMHVCSPAVQVWEG